MRLVASVGLPEIIAGIMLLALNAYVLTGGADFGGGVWDLLARGRGPSRDEQRSLIERSIAPIWEANHVWLIVVVVLLFSAFPPAFATLGVVLHIPISLMLVGIVLRGSAFVFRSYDARARVGRWDSVFAVTSLITPVVLGMIIGAIVSERVGVASTHIGAAGFADVFVWPWISTFTIVVGAFALALFAFLAATYLTVAADTELLRETFRRRALGAAAAVFVLAATALALSFQAAPRVAHGVAGAWWSMPLHLCTGGAAITAIVALWRRQYRLARIAAGTQASLVLWGWALAQVPYLIPATLTIRDAASPPQTLTLLLIGLCAGFVILIPSLRYLYRTFARPSSA